MACRLFGAKPLPEPMLQTNGRLANLELPSLVKEATVRKPRKI